MLTAQLQARCLENGRPNLALPQMRRAVFCVSGQNPDNTLVDFYSGNRSSLGGSGGQGVVLDPETGGYVISATTAGYYQMAQTERMAQASAALTLMIRVNLSSINTINQPITAIANNLAGYMMQITPGSSSQVYAQTNANGTVTSAFLNMTFNEWVTLVARFQQGGDFRMTIFDDRGIQLQDSTGGAGSGAIEWDLPNSIFPFGNNAGLCDFVLLLPTFESDRAIGDLIRRRREMLAPAARLPRIGPGGQLFTQAVSGSVAGSPTVGEIPHKAAPVVVGRADVVAVVGTQKSAILPGILRGAASLAHPALVASIPRVTMTMAGTFARPIAARLVSASTTYAGTFGDFIVLHVAAATATMTGATAHALQYAVSGAAGGGASLARAIYAGITGSVQGAATMFRRLVLTADQASTRMAAAFQTGKTTILQGSAGSRAALARALSASRIAAAKTAAMLGRAPRVVIAAAVNGAVTLGRALTHTLDAAIVHPVGSVLSTGRRAVAARSGSATRIAHRVGAVRAAAVRMAASALPARLFHVASQASARASVLSMRNVFKPLTVVVNAIAAVFTGVVYPPQREIHFTQESITTSRLANERLDQ